MTIIDIGEYKKQKTAAEKEKRLADLSAKIDRLKAAHITRKENHIAALQGLECPECHAKLLLVSDQLGFKGICTSCVKVHKLPK